MSDDDRLREQLRSVVDREKGRPDFGELYSRARRHRTRAAWGAGLVATLTFAVFALAVAALLPLGEDAGKGQAGAEGGLPMVAEIRCDERGAILLTPEVQPSTDGVHLTVKNMSGMRLSIDLGTLGTDSVPAGGANFVLPFQPGAVSLACHLPGQPGGSAELQVSDEAGVWIPVALDCEVYEGVGSTGEDPELGDPVSLARTRLRDLRGGDVVEIAGYPDASTRSVRVLRDGSVIAVLRFRQSNGDAWSLLGMEVCAGSGLRL